MDGCKTKELEAVAGNLETDGFYCLPPSEIRDGRRRADLQRDTDSVTRPNTNENLIFVNSYCRTRNF